MEVTVVYLMIALVATGLFICIIMNVPPSEEEIISVWKFEENSTTPAHPAESSNIIPTKRNSSYIIEVKSCF
ncbi:hypothetical protein ES702_04122 [subsurface metagenome]